MQNPDLKIIHVHNTEEMKQAFAIREAVYIDEQQIRREEEFDEFDPKSRHFLVFMQDVPCGTARWRFTDQGIKLERFAVLAEFRKRGIASALVRELIKDIRKHPGYHGQTLYLNAQVKVIPLYSKQGFVATGPFFEECDIQHRRMELVM